MADLKTRYMGIDLRSPIIIGASDLVTDLHNLRKLEEYGAGAVVYKSLFEEQVELENLDLYERKTEYEDRHAEQVTLFPDSQHVPDSPVEHLLNLRKAREALTIPLLASLNAVNTDVWVDYAIRVAETGVDGLELNFYSLPDGADDDKETIENLQIETLRKVKAAVKIPVAVKLTPYYTNVYRFITELDKAGADGIVIFNRMLHPDIDVYSEKYNMPYNLSSSEENRLPLRYTGMLYGAVNSSLCASRGIFSANDVIKMILAGADAVQIVSTLYHNRLEVVKSIVEETGKWMDSHSYPDLASFRGKLSRGNLTDKLPFTRGQYLSFMMNASGIMKKYRSLH